MPILLIKEGELNHVKMYMRFNSSKEYKIKTKYKLDSTEIVQHSTGGQKRILSYDLYFRPYLSKKIVHLIIIVSFTFTFPIMNILQNPSLSMLGFDFMCLQPG